RQIQIPKKWKKTPMEISSPLHSICRVWNSLFLQPSPIQVPLPYFSPFLFSSQHNCPPHKPLISLPQRPSNTRHLFQKKPPSATRSLPDNGASVDLVREPVRIDPSLAVKKKATEISNDLKGVSIFLVGMNNAIKTSVGKVIADALRYYYFDSDSLVEEAAGSESSGKFFRERDEDGFRESETEVLKQLSSMGRLVVSTGNGAVQSAANLALLRHGISIWIDIPLDMIAKEIIEEGNHDLVSTPELSSEVLTQLTTLYKESRGGYATADASVSLQKVASKLGFDELDEVTDEDMALEVLKEIEKLTRVKKMMEEARRPF
ncbi:hypothetical protein Ancab_026410, partial [Ancistrocladus abbreviatus]